MPHSHRNNPSGIKSTKHETLCSGVAVFWYFRCLPEKKVRFQALQERLPLKALRLAISVSARLLKKVDTAKPIHAEFVSARNRKHGKAPPSHLVF